MEDKKNTTLERQQYTTRLFYFSFEILAYFAVPAVLTVLLGKYLKNNHALDITIPLLFVSYIVSWIIFAVRYRSLRKQQPVPDKE
ncbi:MAG: hypothetical protein KBC22_00760 [Candidatus Pacebacteria bacterium]|nr:hypothetical protein [Candidatus Paceibacterota bacterium]